MREIPRTAVAVVGLGAVLPDATDVASFWSNLQAGRYSISETPVDRWDPALYYDPDPHAPDKTYSKIGGWVRRFDWDPLGWRLPIPPKVAEAMDRTQKFAVVASRQALADYGWPGRKLDGERTAVILGNAMAGEMHYKTALRLTLPELERTLEGTAAFAALPEAQRSAIRDGFRGDVAAALPTVTEDTMPGELANIIAGRVAALFDFHGPNYTVDAACASAMAALSAALEGLEEGDFDAVLTGGIDANMGAHTFIKFAKIGALSATGTRPFAAGADGFVMGEGGAVLLLKRLGDAERDGDRIYAVLRGVGGSSDGRGKGITAPNPIGQRLAVGRAWRDAGLDPATVGLIEGHGTSTRVGDQTELESLDTIFGGLGLRTGSVPLGSVKSNIGHLKGAAGAAGLLKTILALHHRQIPPSLNFDRPNPAIDFSRSPFFVNTRLAPWEPRDGVPRRAGVSAFGFGGTNFHTVVEDYVPGRIDAAGRGRRAMVAVSPAAAAGAAAVPRTPPRGALLLGAADEAGLAERLAAVVARAEAGEAPPPAPAAAADLAAPQRLAIDYADAADLAVKGAKALRAFSAGQAGMWRALRAQGIFRGAGAPGKVAFLYTGQGSQYAGMLQELAGCEPVVARTFAEADRVMEPLLGAALTSRIFPSRGDEAELAEIEEGLRQTAITQPAVLSVSISLTRLLAEYGLVPDLVMGHSLGEYGALVAAGVLSFPDALEAVSARGREMTRLAVDDPGRMAAVMAPIPDIERILAETEGYVVVANLNSGRQAVIGGASEAVERASAALAAAGYTVRPLSVSHAFHTEIVAPASVPLREVLRRIGPKPPAIPVVANVSGRFYPMGPGVEEEVIDLLARQIASPVRFVDGLETLWEAGARIFVEIGPKRALAGFVEDVVGDREGAVALATNHPKIGDLASVNQAICGLWAAGVGVGVEPRADLPLAPRSALTAAAPPVAALRSTTPPPAPVATADRYAELGRLFAQVLDRGWEIWGGGPPRPAATPVESVVITGAALGLPGMPRIFDDGNLGRLLAGETLIDAIPMRLRKRMVEKNVTRLVKDDGGGGPRFEVIADVGEVIKLAARGGQFDLAAEYGVAPERVEALDRTTQLALAAGLDALRDAGIPLVQNYKTTSRGTRLPDRWLLPESLRDSTGVIFASAFPGLDAMAEISEHYYADRERRARAAELEALRRRLATVGAGREALAEELERRSAALASEIERQAFAFDRRFLFRVLSMGHSQFAELIGARGPNTQVNAACASSAQALAIASDWLRAGRCKRVVVVSADDVTSDNLLPWIGAGFLASGAAATDEKVEDAAIPFDRRRHGMLLGMGAAALVLETTDGARERGVAPICELLGTVFANSAFHGTRLDVEHIGRVMERLVGEAEVSCGLDRHQMAPQTMFVSHETYTPARGGSAQAEVDALRRVFGPSADRIVIANTKGFTGHPMGVGIEEVVAVKALETGLVPPVANHREEDPDLGHLNLSLGGGYPIRYALRLAAGFGSQIAMTLLRWVETPAGHRRPDELGFAYRVADRGRFQDWLASASGDSAAELEVVHRTLRVRDRGPAARPAGLAEPPAPRPSAEAVSATPPASAAFSARADAGPAAPERGPADGRAAGAGDPGRSESGVAAPSAPVTASPPSAPPPAAAVPAGTPPDSVAQRVLELVAEQTGYPPDMLDPELDLEADLGIDTVKQAEMFAAIRGEWGIPRDENLKLRDYPTLAHAVQFVYDRRPDLAEAQDRTPVASRAGGVEELGRDEYGAAAPPLQAPTGPASAPAAPGLDPVRVRVLELVAQQTGYPPEMLDPELDLEADLGIDTVKQAEMFAAIRGEWGIPRDENLALRDYPTLAHAVQFVYDRRPDLAAAPTAATPAAGTNGQVAAPAASASASSALPGSSSGAPAGDDDPVRVRVLELVAQQTGYPPEMLDPELDLEADLGIDTVKQAEMFAAIRGEWGIPRDENLALRDYPTLAHAVKFVYAHRPDLAAAQARPAEAPPSPPPLAAGEPADSAAASSAVPASSSGGSRVSVRRVPVPVLRPPLDLCAPTGAELGAGARVALMPDRGGVGKALATRLHKLGVEVLALDPGEAPEELAARLAAWAAEGPVAGLFWLPALDDEGDPATLAPEAWREAVRVRVKGLAAAARALYEPLGRPEAFLVAATRLGGLHGAGPERATAPLGGAVSGFVKAFAREREAATVKVVDFAASRKTAEPAETLIAETLRDPGAVEIGTRDGGRWTLGLVESSFAEVAPAAHGGLTIGPASVVVVTGAAGSIVAAIVADLAAAAGGGTFHLLDLAPPPDPADSDLARFQAGDRDGLKRDLFARLQAAGQKPTPARIERELAVLEREAAAAGAQRAIEAAGGTAHYHRVDLRDGAAVAQALAGLRATAGHIDLLVHAGGLEISKRLPDKAQEEFDRVFDVKADGWVHLLAAAADLPIAAAVVFTSIAGRFGNAGQTDYSAANDFLVKATADFARRRPGAIGLALDWTAWADLGMATRGSIPQIMAAAGIDLLPPAEGVPVVRTELAAATCGEVVVAGRLGAMLADRAPAGGLDLAPDGALAGRLAAAGPLVGRVAGLTPAGVLAVEVDLDPAELPFLDHHRIDGIPVLPGVMGIEGFAEAAGLLAPGLDVAAVEDVEFLAPFKFYRDQPRTVRIEARLDREPGGGVSAACRLLGQRELPGRGEVQETVHFTARVRLAAEAGDPAGLAAAAVAPPAESGPAVAAGDLYRIYFHGPAYQVVGRAWVNDGAVVGRFAAGLPPDLPGHPGDGDGGDRLRMAPRLLELCLQTAGVGELGSHGRMALPRRVARAAVTRSDLGPGPFFAVVRAGAQGVEAVVRDGEGRAVATVSGYETIELPATVGEAELAPLRATLTPT